MEALCALIEGQLWINFKSITSYLQLYVPYELPIIEKDRIYLYQELFVNQNIFIYLSPYLTIGTLSPLEELRRTFQRSQSRFIKNPDEFIIYPSVHSGVHLIIFRLNHLEQKNLISLFYHFQQRTLANQNLLRDETISQFTFKTTYIHLEAQVKRDLTFVTYLLYNLDQENLTLRYLDKPISSFTARNLLLIAVNIALLQQNELTAFLILQRNLYLREILISQNERNIPLRRNNPFNPHSLESAQDLNNLLNICTDDIKSETSETNFNFNFNHLSIRWRARST